MQPSYFERRVLESIRSHKLQRHPPAWLSAKDVVDNIDPALLDEIADTMRDLKMRGWLEEYKEPSGDYETETPDKYDVRYGLTEKGANEAANHRARVRQLSDEILERLLDEDGDPAEVEVVMHDLKAEPETMEKALKLLFGDNLLTQFGVRGGGMEQPLQLSGEGGRRAAQIQRGEVLAQPAPNVTHNTVNVSGNANVGAVAAGNQNTVTGEVKVKGGDFKAFSEALKNVVSALPQAENQVFQQRIEQRLQSLEDAVRQGKPGHDEADMVLGVFSRYGPVIQNAAIIWNSLALLLTLLTGYEMPLAPEGLGQ